MKKNIGLISILSIALAGCGLTLNQKEATTRFATASMSMGNFAAQEFASLRQATIEMNTKNIAIGGKADKTMLDGAFKVDAVTTRIKTAEALASYGRLLMALLNDSQEAELRDASNQFADSVKAAGSDLDGVGTAVYAIGGLFIEHQKAAALTKIATASKDVIDQLCDKLIDDFTPTAGHLAQGFDDTSIQLQNIADTVLDKPGLDMQNRLMVIDAFKYGNDQMVGIEAIGKQASASLTALKTANAELVNTLENDKLNLTDLKALGKNIKELSAIVKALSGK